MTSVTWRCWLLYQVASLPLALFCWYATLFWIAVLIFHSAAPNVATPWPVSGADVMGAVGFWSFTIVHLLGLRFGDLVKPAWRWLLLVTPIPWLAAFLVHQFDEDLSFPGDGMLPPALGTAATGYLVVLLALLVAALFAALAEGLGSLFSRARA